MIDGLTVWERVGRAVKELADDEDIVAQAIALRARVIDGSGNEDDVTLSASLSALVVREFEPLATAQDDEPVSVVVRFVLPRDWKTGDDDARDEALREALEG